MATTSTARKASICWPARATCSCVKARTSCSASCKSRPERVRPRRDAASARHFLPQQLVDLRRVRLALARLHHLAYQRVEGLVLARLVLVDRLRIGRQHLVDDGLERTSVAHLLQAELLDGLIDYDRVGDGNVGGILRQRSLLNPACGPQMIEGLTCTVV